MLIPIFSDFYLKKKEMRTELARKLREYLSDICRLLNLSRNIYKAKNEEEVKLPDGGVREMILTHPRS